ncbi:MAG: hypothetical protein ABIB93_07515 [Chloroflexota bacterium]
MTNTLHRFGKPEDLKDDYVAFIKTTPGMNDIGSAQKAKDFLRVALKYNPVNLVGNSDTGPKYRPEKNLNLFKLYLRGRKETVLPEQMIEEMGQQGKALVVFDNKAALEGFLKEVKEMDMGLSVNVSSLVDDVREMSPRIGVVPHSINYALGFTGNLYRLPGSEVLALTTMCGHGLIASNFAKKMIDRVKEGRITPEKAAGYMAKFCVCGAFNPSRAARVLRELRMSKPNG